jgi:hypothetical protein
MSVDDICPFCKLEWAECACEEPSAAQGDFEDVICTECGKSLFECDCDVRILEEEGA